jgi:hypothetical protein|tara:strand:- start:214 stop:438 length:225 start_codon:yes stop_codon:yes gene_type:complete
MDIDLSSDDSTKKIDFITLQKMVFIYNALEKGWAVKKNKNSYIFTKNHEGKKEVFLDDYLKHFMTENFDINKIT